MSWNGEGKLLLAINLSLCVSGANTCLSPPLKAVGSSESFLRVYFRDRKLIRMDILLKIREVSVNEFGDFKVKSEKAGVRVN